MTDDFENEMDDVTGDPNAGAYSKTEYRHGPPLDYISEKIEHSLIDLHAAIRAIDKSLETSDKKDGILLAATAAFQQELVAFLALQNLLKTANTPGLLQQLLSLSREEFAEWIQQIQNEGSVTG